MGPFPHDAPPAKISDTNPAGTDGFEFVEFAHPEPEKLAVLFERMYEKVAKRVLAELAEKSRLAAQLGDTDRDIGRCAAGGFVERLDLIQPDAAAAVITRRQFSARGAPAGGRW